MLAAAVFGGLLLMTGCSESDAGGTASGDASAGATTTASASASPAVDDNTKKVCADITALNAEVTQKVAVLAAEALQALAADNEAKADEVIAQMQKLIPELADKVQALAATASNAELKQVLTTYAADLRAANEDDVEAVITAAETKYKAICGS
jgi:hypothetical protein